MSDTYRIISGFSEVIASYDTYIVDLWGVVHDGHLPLPGVIDLLEHLKAHHKQVIFLTNAPRRSALVQEQLSRLGVPRSLYDYVYS